VKKEQKAHSKEYIYIYIYIYVCVCVCVCVKIKEKQINGGKHILMAVPLIGKEKGESKIMS